MDPLGLLVNLALGVPRPTLGSYRLLAPLGRGGMGEVYRAEHRMLARPAAVKLVHPDKVDGFSGVEMRARFAREAKVTASLRSPHTVQLYDYGTTDDGSFFYAMELLEGFPLDALVARFGPQPPGRVVNVLAQACRSLEEAHLAGLVHRDVKPSNLFLCRLGATAPVAVRAGRSRRSSTRASRRSPASGRPRRGRSRRVSSRSTSRRGRGGRRRPGGGPSPRRPRRAPARGTRECGRPRTRSPAGRE